MMCNLQQALAGGPALARRDRRQSSSLFLISTNRELVKLPNIKGSFISNVNCLMKFDVV